MYPVSKPGRVVTVLAILCGVIFMSMPITIVGNNFTLAIEEKVSVRVTLRVTLTLAIEEKEKLAVARTLTLT